MAVDVKEQLHHLKAYSPGKTSEEVKREYGLSEIIKLASNENPYGCSPKVLEAISAIPSFAIYPDGAATELRQHVIEHVQADESKLSFPAGWMN